MEQDISKQEMEKRERILAEAEFILSRVEIDDSQTTLGRIFFLVERDGKE